MMRLLERASNLEGWPLFVWTVADGLKRFSRTDVIPQTYDFRDALRHIDKTSQNGIYVLLDPQPYFEDPVNVRLIKEVAQEYARTARTLVFVSQQLDVPPALQRMCARFALPLPTTQEIRELIKQEAQLWERENGQPIKGQQQAVDMLVQHLSGMCQDDAQRLIRQAIRDDNAITLEDLHRVLRFKRESLGEGGLLDFEIDTGSFSPISCSTGTSRK